VRRAKPLPLIIAAAVMAAAIGVRWNAAIATSYAAPSTSKAEPARPAPHAERVTRRGGRRPTERRGPRHRPGHRGSRRQHRPLNVLVSEGAHDSTAALVTAGATSLAALAAVFAFVVAWLTVHDNRRTERKRREDDSLTARERLTYEYVGRLEDLALTDHKAVMASFLRGGFRPPGMRDADWQAAKAEGPVAAGLAAWEYLSSSESVEDRRAVLQIVAFPNMLETIAGMYNHGLLDYGIVKTRIENQATTFWKQAEWWIEALQRQYDDETLKDLRVMIDDLPKQVKPSPYQA
jgi:hypothetical protein